MKLFTRHPTSVENDYYPVRLSASFRERPKDAGEILPVVESGKSVCKIERAAGKRPKVLSFATLLGNFLACR